MPDTFPKLAKIWRKYFPTMYDTKVLSVATNQFSKTDLLHLFYKCTNDKKLNNNLVIEFDKQREIIFGLYEQNGGQGHDAGYDAYMTGHVFLCISKYIEIGNIIAPAYRDQMQLT